MKLFIVLVSIVLGVNAGPAFVLNEIRGAHAPFDTYGLPGSSFVSLPPQPLLSAEPLPTPYVSVQESNDLEVPVNPIVPFGGQQLTLVPVHQSNPSPVASLVHELPAVQPLAGNQVISVESNPGAAPCPPQIVVVALPPQFGPQAHLSPIPIQLPQAPVQKIYLQPAPIPAPAPAPLPAVQLESIPEPGPQLFVEEPQAPVALDLQPVVQPIEVPQPVQLVEQSLIAESLVSEPCQSDVVEPEPAVYVAPPPAPALLELPPVVQPQRVVLAPEPVAVLEDPVAAPLVDADCGDAAVISEPAPIAAPILAEPFVPAPAPQLAHIGLTISDAQLPAPIYGIASPVVQQYFAPAPVQQYFLEAPAPLAPAPAPVQQYFLEAPAPAPVLVEAPKIVEQQIISAPYPPAVEEVAPVAVEEHVEPCVSVEAAPALAPVELVAPAPVEIVEPAPAPAPVELVPQTLVNIVKNPPVVVDAPYPAALPFPTHYGEPALPLRFLLLNNSI